jgi:hypothetical protein
MVMTRPFEVALVVVLLVTTAGAGRASGQPPAAAPPSRFSTEILVTPLWIS